MHVSRNLYEQGWVSSLEVVSEPMKPNYYHVVDITTLLTISLFLLIVHTLALK